MERKTVGFSRENNLEGLEAETESFEYEEGGGEVHHFQGRTRYPKIEGYPETCNNSWRADNDQAFIDACNNLMKNMVYQKVMTDMFHLKC